MFYLAHQQILDSIAGTARALTLVDLGIVLVTLEFLRPGLILPAVGGTLLLTLGGYSLASSGFGLGRSASGPVLGLFVIFAIVAGWLLPMAVRARRNKTSPPHGTPPPAALKAYNQ